MRWWENSSSDDADYLHAGELVAFDVFEPGHRSRGAPRRNALQHVADPAFRADMEALFSGPPDGEFGLPWLWDRRTRLEQIEHRLSAIEQRLDWVSE